MIWLYTSPNLTLYSYLLTSLDLIHQGDNYWRFNGKIPDTGYPKKISKGFAGVPDNIDAAFVWSGNGKIYFFKVRGVAVKRPVGCEMLWMLITVVSEGHAGY